MTCLVSFRAFFVRKESQANAAGARAIVAYYEAKSPGMRAKAKQLQRSFIDTCKTLDLEEGWELASLPVPPSGRLSLEFTSEDNGSRTRGSFNDQLGSIRTLQPVHYTADQVRLVDSSYSYKY